jgi:Tol biopolymer transport system component
VSDEQNITEIYTISVSGEGKFQVTRNDTYDFSPSYSPDGKRIAYVGGDGDGNDYEIFKISPTGGTPVNLTANNTNDFHPSWGSRP